MDGREGLPVLPKGRDPRDHAARPDPGTRRRSRCDPIRAVRRCPPRRPRVRARLTPALGRRGPPADARFDGPPDPTLSSPRPGTIWYPDLPRFHADGSPAVSPHGCADPSAPDLAVGRCRDLSERAAGLGTSGWLSLGPASELLGIDPDTLRRWADEGRVPAWTTAGGAWRLAGGALHPRVRAL